MDDLISRQVAIDRAVSIPMFGRDVKMVAVSEIKNLPSAQPEPLKIDLSGYSEEDWERLKKEWRNTPITVLSAQPKRGKWIKKHRHYGGFRSYTGFDAMGEQHTVTVDERTEYDDLYCSECGARSADNFLNFCPNCGADMRGEQDG